MLLAVLVGSCLISIRQLALNNQFLVDHFNQKVSIEGVIQSDPYIKIGKVVGSNRLNDQYSALFKLTKIDGTKVDLPTRLKFELKNKVAIDQKVSLDAKIIKSRERKVAALLIANGPIRILSEPRKIFTTTSVIRNSFKKLAKASDAGALIPGLVLGDTSLQSADFTDQMRRVGLSHLTAVSGANFVLVATFLLWVLKYFVTNLRLRLQLVFVFLLVFIFLVRPTPSVLRAAVMTGVVLVARARGEKSFGLSALGCAIALLVLIDPFQSVDPGFALSVLATAGILILSPIIKVRLLKYLKVDWIVEALAIPVSATVFCMPVIVLLSGQFAPVTIPANILVAPVIAPITVLGFIAALLSPFLARFSELILLLTTPFASWIVWVCHKMNDLPVITFIQSGLFIAIFAVAIAAFLYRKLWIVITITGLVISQLFFSAMMWPGLGWQIVNCDVGQGDGLVVNLGGGSGILVDTGPDPAKIDRCLHKLKIKKIPLLVLTHFHADHVGGISSVIKNRDIGQVWISNLPKPEQTYKQVISELSKFKVRTVEQGDKFIFKSNQVEIRVLWPSRQVQEFESLPGDGSAINNSSISLMIKSRDFSLFTAGDIEPEVQELITNSGFLSAVDILKINHHGSKYQYLPMLDLLNPKVAIISVGAGNTYGHPDPAFIGELRRRNIQVWRTDYSGGVSVASPNKIRVTGKEWWRIKWG